MGRPVEAVDAFVSCLQVSPDLGAAYVNLATTLRGLGLIEQARVMAELAVQRLPDEPEAKICLAAALHDQTDYPAAVKLYRQVLARAPRHAGALSSLENSPQALGHVSESLAAHDRAVAAAPGEPGFLFNQATSLLMAGDFERGWDAYEWRWQNPPGRARDLGSLWQGEDIAGRTILLHAEQGLGDTLQFVRYVPLVAARGARVVLEAQPSLVRLFWTLPGARQVIARGDALPAHDVHCPLLSLPRAFATRVETIPDHVPYLHADADAIAAGGKASGRPGSPGWHRVGWVPSFGRCRRACHRSLPLHRLGRVRALGRHRRRSSGQSPEGSARWARLDAAGAESCRSHAGGRRFRRHGRPGVEPRSGHIG